MQADWEDAPEHLRRRKPGPWRLIAVASIGTLLTFGALALMDFGIVIDVSKLNEAFQIHTANTSHTQSQPTLADVPVQAETPVPIAVSPHPSYPVTRPSAPQERTDQGKQTAFNDYNYTPKPVVNTYRASSSAPVAEIRPTQRQQIQSITKSARWEWESGYEKKRVSGWFEWVERNGVIDLSSICQNYRSGSFIYRDCRKGAKVALQNMCGSYEPACYAGRNMTP